MSNDALSADMGTVPQMDRRDVYLFKAAELLEVAKVIRYGALKAQFEHLAVAYMRLADQVQENTGNNGVEHELPLTRILDNDLQK
jgi:hypothetical protein